MGVPAGKLPGLLAYCRIDALAEGEEALLDLLYDSAVQYLSQAGISAPSAGTTRGAQYDLAVSALVLDSYDRRDATMETSASENPSFRRLLNQLKLTEPETEVAP